MLVFYCSLTFSLSLSLSLSLILHYLSLSLSLFFSLCHSISPSLMHTHGQTHICSFFNCFCKFLFFFHKFTDCSSFSIRLSLSLSLSLTLSLSLCIVCFNMLPRTTKDSNVSYSKYQFIKHVPQANIHYAESIIILTYGITVLTYTQVYMCVHTGEYIDVYTLSYTHY